MSDSHILPDVLQPDLKLVFCGTAASDVSAARGAYYANPTNYFWRTLYAVGLTSRQFVPSEFRTLPQVGIGLTDLAKAAQGNDNVLSEADFDVAALRRKIDRYQPRLLAFTSKKAASVFWHIPTRKIAYGLQDQTLNLTQFWVLTSPSGAARSYWDQSVWQALADYVGNLP